MVALLDVVNLSAAYGELTVLRDVSICVQKGEVHAVIGANGAGKTTLLRAISGFERRASGAVTGGRVSFDGEEITGLEASLIARKGLRVVPEQVSVFLPLTIEENLRLALGTKGEGGGSRHEVFDLLMELFPVLVERRHQHAGLLSGGERQMLGISMALIGTPKLLLIDEASIGLSPAAVRNIFSTLRELRERLDLTILLVEQNLEAALTVADYVHVMRGGSFVYASDSASSVERQTLYQFMTGSAN